MPKYKFIIILQHDVSLSYRSCTNYLFIYFLFLRKVKNQIIFRNFSVCCQSCNFALANKSFISLLLLLFLWWATFEKSNNSERNEKKRKINKLQHAHVKVFRLCAKNADSVSGEKVLFFLLLFRVSLKVHFCVPIDKRLLNSSMD